MHTHQLPLFIACGCSSLIAHHSGIPQGQVLRYLNLILPPATPKVKTKNNSGPGSRSRAYLAEGVREYGWEPTRTVPVLTNLIIPEAVTGITHSTRGKAIQIASAVKNRHVVLWVCKMGNLN